MDEVYLAGWRGLVMLWERICSDIGFFKRCYYLIVNEILNLMTQSKTLVGVMTMLLVICAVFCRVVRGWE